MQRSALKTDPYCLFIYCLLNDAIRCSCYVRKVEMEGRTMSCRWHLSVLGKTTQIVGRIAKLLLPLALQPTVGYGLSNNGLLFFPICHQLSPSSHSQHLKISFYFLFPSFPGSSPSSRPFQFLNEGLFGHPILLHSL